MIGRKISHYIIERDLRTEGVGRVYRAIDERIDRPVAIKVLPARLSANESVKKEFIQQAEAASALNHPNITAIHEIGETDDGMIFIVMEYFEAESLRTILRRDSLSITESTGIILQIASGLAKAHEKGIVHGSINPSNILITADGISEVTDFGLAKFFFHAEDPDFDGHIGSLAYISPEQLRGESIDHRIDIWSLGIVFYEILAGRLPFEGEYDQAIIYAIISKEPGSMTAANVRVPQYIENAVLKALSKEKENRYGSFGEMIDDLNIESAQFISLPTHEKSIVVLPFEDISPDADNEYFSNGLTEEIIVDLSKVQSLRVISRKSSMRLEGTCMDSRMIGRKLGVQYMLEGSVRKAGNNIRITAQLIDTQTDDNIWADKYDGNLQDVFDMQERVSRSIVEALKLELSPEEDRRIAERPLDNIHAYQCYLRARQEVMHFTKEGLDSALQSLEQGLDIVGENALLLGGIGYVYWRYVNDGFIPPGEYLPKVEEYAGRIFELEPNSSRGHLLLGMVNLTEAHLEKAVYHLKQTLTTDPSDLDALFWLVILYGNAGRPASALQLAEHLALVDPLTPINKSSPGFAYLTDGRFDLALEKVRKWCELESDSAIAHFWYAWVLAQVDRIDEACSLFERGAEIDPGNLWAKLGMIERHALRSQSNALKLLRAELVDIAKWDPHYSLFLAESHSIIGETGEALDWLENAVERGFINYPFISDHDRHLEKLRGEERLIKLLQRVESEWQRFEA